KIVQRLQNQHPEHHDRIDRLPASAALPHFVRRQYNRLNVGAEALPRHQSINRFKRIAFRRQARQPLFCIEEPELTHPSLPNHAVTLETRTTRSKRVFFEAPHSIGGQSYAFWWSVLGQSADISAAGCWPP